MKFNNICIIDAKRSAIGRFMGTLAGADPADISAQVIRGGFDSALIAKVQEVILGNVYSTNLGQGIARKIAVNAGVPVETPAYAVSALLEETGTDLKNIGCLEMNEAFAAQALGCVKLLSEKYSVSEDEILKMTNLYGSGLGLGHPLGATGARIVVTLAHLLKNRSERRGVASLCIGGGMGAAVMLERPGNQ